MPKIVQQVMLTLDEVQEAFAGLQIVDVDGERCVDGVELLRAVEILVRGEEPTSRVQAARDPEMGVPPRADPTPRAGSPGGTVVVTTMDPMAAQSIEEAAEILAGKSLGNCVGCGQPRDECPCDTYVDSVVRDPMEYARDLMQKGQPAPPWWPAGGTGIESAVSQFDVAAIGLHTGNPATGQGRFPAHDGAPVQ